MNVHPAEYLAENEVKDQSWSTSKYENAKQLRDTEARRLRSEGWTVKTEKFNFGAQGGGILYKLEANRKRQPAQEMIV